MINKKYQDQYQTMLINGITYIKVARYSQTGFKPRCQSKHIMDYYFYNKYDFDIMEFPESTRETILDIHNKELKFWEDNLYDLTYGLWVFIAGQEESRDFFLNHLDEHPDNIPRSVGYLPEDTPAFDVSNSYKGVLTDIQYLGKGCYIPAKYLEKLIILG